MAGTKLGCYYFHCMRLHQSQSELQDRPARSAHLSAENRLEIETKLRESEAFSTTILECSPDCVKVLDAAGRLTFMNEAGCRLLGIERIDELLGKRWVDFWLPPENVKAARALKLALHGKPARFEGFRPTLQGEPKWWNAIVTMLPSDPRRFLIVSRDITTEKKNEALLRRLNEKLEERVNERTAALNRAHGKVVMLARKLVKTGQDERQHLAKELHDEMGQHLTALRLTMENLEADFPACAEAKLKQARRLLRTVTRQVRDVSFDLRQALPEHLSLTAALNGHFAKARALYGLKIRFEPGSSPLESVPPEISWTVLRLVQESLTNVVKHANVKTAQVKLAVSGNNLSLDVIDKGRGFGASARRTRRLGHLGMEERVLLLGGKLQVTSTPGAGTHVNAVLPLKLEDYDQDCINRGSPPRSGGVS